MKLRAFLFRAESVERYLRHVGESTEVFPLARHGDRREPRRGGTCVASNAKSSASASRRPAHATPIVSSARSSSKWSTNVVLHCAGSTDGKATVLAHMSAGAVALDGQFVYYVADKEIGRIAKSGGPRETLAWGLQPVDIAVDSTNVYFSDAGDRTIRKLPK
jgi:hypothetical protein